MHTECKTHLGNKASGLERHYVKKLECRIPRRHTYRDFVSTLARCLSVSMYSALMSGPLKASQVEATLIL